MDFNRFGCATLLLVSTGFGSAFANDPAQKESATDKKASVSESAARKCESGPRDIEYIYAHGDITRCFYPNQSLEQAYQAHRAARSDSENLLPTLTLGKDRKIEHLGDADLVEYIWKGNNELNITQSFPGGVTEFRFTADKTGTAVTETGYPD